MRLRNPWTWAFVVDERGASAVEFGLAAPILAFAVLIIGDGANLVLHYYDMRAAVSSAAQYAMVGGTDPNAISSVALSAWTTRAPSGLVTVSNACLCAAASNACNSLCPDQSVPLSFTTIQATSSFSGALISQTMSAQQVVRVR
jgi:Flp pilus assembly protein TadG